jgi:hypothetical protein
MKMLLFVFMVSGLFIMNVQSKADTRKSMTNEERLGIAKTMDSRTGNRPSFERALRWMNVLFPESIKKNHSHPIAFKI